MNYLISIIMGVYNAEDTLQLAINSIINQTYSDWEFIICDDGSTDASLSILEQFNDPRIIIIKNKKNMGLGNALNRCLEKARGIYIARMDADDISLPERLEKEIQFLINNPQYDIVSTSLTMFNREGDFYTTTAKNHPEAKDFITGSPVAHPASMMRRECLQSVGGYNEGKNTLRVEDTDLWFRLLENGCRFYILSEPLYKLRFDRKSVERQKLRYRWNSTIVRIKGCRKLNLPLIYYFLSFKSVIIGIFPTSLRYRLHMMKMKR